MKTLAWFITGLAITGAIAFGLYEADKSHQSTLPSPYTLPNAPWTDTLRESVADAFPGGFFRPYGDYYRCEDGHWVVRKANHDMLVLGDSHCWAGRD